MFKAKAIICFVSGEEVGPQAKMALQALGSAVIGFWEQIQDSFSITRIAGTGIIATVLYVSQS